MTAPDGLRRGHQAPLRRMRPDCTVPDANDRLESEAMTAIQSRPALQVPYAMNAPRPCPRPPLLRPGVLRHGSGAPVAARVADGVPVGRHREAGRLRRVRDPRPVGDRRARRREHGEGVQQRVPSPRREARRRPREQRERVHLPVPRLVLGSRRRQHVHVPARPLRRSQLRRHRPPSHGSAGRDVGRVRVHQLRRRRAGPARRDRAVRRLPRRVAHRRPAGGVVALLRAPHELEARHGSVHGGLPRDGDAPAVESARAEEPRRRGVPQPQRGRSAGSDDVARSREPARPRVSTRAPSST